MYVFPPMWLLHVDWQSISISNNFQRWFGRSDHYPSSLRLRCIYTCTFNLSIQFIWSPKMNFNARCEGGLTSQHEQSSFDHFTVTNWDLCFQPNLQLESDMTIALIQSIGAPWISKKACFHWKLKFILFFYSCRHRSQCEDPGDGHSSPATHPAKPPVFLHP